MTITPRRLAASTLLLLAIATVVSVAALIAVLVWLNNYGMEPGTAQDPLLVYCAVSVQPAVREIAKSYEQATATPVRVQTGSSGALETQIRLSKKGDLFIPAAQSPYLDRCQADGTVTDVVPLAKFRLVVALHPRAAGVEAVTLKTLLNGKLRYALANVEAAAGLVTREVLEPQGVWPEIERGAKAVMPTVTGVAQAIQQGVAVDCGFVWDTTAHQFGLATVDLPELEAGRAVVAAGVLSSSADSVAARKFAEYLAAPGKGGGVFLDLGYSQ